MSIGAVSALAWLGIGGCILEQYLTGSDPVSWLTTNVGMGTPADLSIVLAAVIVILLIVAAFTAHKMLSNQNTNRFLMKSLL